MKHRIGFFMSQTAGNITYDRNLRKVVKHDPEIEASWTEVHYYKEGGTVEQLAEHVVPIMPGYVRGVARATLDMRNGLQGKAFDALFINDSVAIFFGKVLRRVPTIIDMDSTPIQIDHMPAYESPKDAWPIAHLKWRLWRRMAHNAAIMQVWSRWAADSVIKDYGVPAERVSINPPGIDLDQWSPPPWPRDPGKQEPLRVLFVGGDFRRKGGHLLLEWFRQRSGRACELHLVTREPVEPGAGVFVYHAMQPNSPELMRLYHLCDLFVLPSLAECFGIATIEAMGTGLPVIASDVGGTADIIDPGRNGYIVPSHDVRALSGALEALLVDDELRRNMGRQSRLIAEQRFDVRANARRVIDQLKLLAEQHHGVIAGRV